MTGIVTFMADEQVYILCDKEGVISGFNSQVEATKHFEAMYNRNHGNGYESSMSACIHAIQFRICTHEIEEIETLGGDVIVIPFRIHSVSSIAGRMIGIKCEGPKAKEYHESGIVPRLI